MTTTEREVHKRLVDLSVIALSALVLGGGYLLASSVDRERAARPVPPAPEESIQLAVSSAEVTDVTPVPGLRPAPPATRRVVVVRRTRAS
jgi:hypothetical protein